VGDFAVDVRDVSKRFRLAHGQYKTVKERLIHGGKRKSTEDFWALDKVSLTVKEGETVGILGRNGSGKSTLLKCICGVLQPTFGEVAVRGKCRLYGVGSRLPAGPDGAENIYLNGSLMGHGQARRGQGLRLPLWTFSSWRNSSTARSSSILRHVRAAWLRRRREHGP